MANLSDDQIAMLKRAIYDISSGDFDATTEEAKLIVEAVLALAAQPQAIAVPAIPEGWQIVPIEPTPEMIDAGCPVGEQFDHFDVKTVYTAMLAAAPQSPAGQQDRGV